MSEGATWIVSDREVSAYLILYSSGDVSFAPQRLGSPHITSHTPEQNGLIDRFFRSLKEECVWQHNFESFSAASEKVGSWIKSYNEQRPHQSLGYQSPAQLRKRRLLVA